MSILGHILVWSAILLVNGQLVTPFAILIFWPVSDTGLAIWRRRKLENPQTVQTVSTFTNLLCGFRNPFLGRDKRHIANPMATVLLIPLISHRSSRRVFWDDFVVTFGHLLVWW